MKKCNQRIKRYMSLLLGTAMTVTMVTSAVGASSMTVWASQAESAVQTETEDGETETEAAETEAAETETEEDTQAALMEAVSGMSGDDGEGDTVYVIADAQGNPEKVYLSEAGSETSTAVSSTDLPVTMKITYTLDGQEIAPEELAGKSGHLVMRFAYTNHEKTSAAVGGTQREVYVPFVMLSGMLFNNDNCSNLQVSSGKIMNDGSHTIVVGYAVPGLRDSLKMDDLDLGELTLDDYFEVTADVTDFSLAATLTMGSSSIFSDMELTKSGDTMADLSDAMSQMTDAMSQLNDGSSQLYDGLTTLLQSSMTLSDGVSKLNTGASKVSDGAAQVSAGIEQVSNGSDELAAKSQELSAGAQKMQEYIGQLSEGLDTLASNNDDLNSGAAQVFDSLCASASSQVNAAMSAIGGPSVSLTRDNYSDVLSGLMGSYTSDAIYSAIYSAQSAQAQAVADAQEGDDGYEALVTATSDQIRSGMLSQLYASASYQEADDEVKAAMEQAVYNTEITDVQIDYYMPAVRANYVDAYMEAAAPTIRANAEALAAGLSTAKASLDAYNQFYQGLNQYTAGVASANENTKQILGGMSSLADGTSLIAHYTGELAAGLQSLKTGAQSLAEGASQVSDGVAALNAGSGTLIDGVTRLQEGSGQLSDGLIQFNDEAVSRLNSEFSEKLQPVYDRFEAVVQAGKDYTYSGADGEHSVKFIFKTAGIE